LWNTLPRVPLYLVWVLGIVFAIVQFRVRPKVAGFVLGAIGAQVLFGLLGFLVNVVLIRHLDFEPAMWISRGFGAVSSLVTAAAWGLVIWAALGVDRPAAQAPPTATC